MLVRSLAPATDVSALQALWRATWLETYGPTLGPDRLHLIAEAVAEPAVLSMFAADGGGFVAAVEGNVVGSACFAERRGVGYIWGMYVHPAHRRRGMGSALLRRAAGAMESATTLELSTVTPAAEAFYRRLGFTVTGHADFEIFPGVTRPSTRLVAEAAAVRAGNPPCAIIPPA